MSKGWTTRIRDGIVYRMTDTPSADASPRTSLITRKTAAQYARAAVAARERNRAATQDELDRLRAIASQTIIVGHAESMPDVQRRVRELGLEADAVSALLSIAARGELVTGLTEDGQMLMASPRDVQCLVKAKRDLLEMMCRLTGVAREPVAQLPRGKTGRRHGAEPSYTPE